MIILSDSSRKRHWAAGNLNLDSNLLLSLKLTYCIIPKVIDQESVTGPLEIYILFLKDRFDSNLDHHQTDLLYQHPKIDSSGKRHWAAGNLDPFCNDSIRT